MLETIERGLTGAERTSTVWTVPGEDLTLSNRATGIEWPAAGGRYTMRVAAPRNPRWVLPTLSRIRELLHLAQNWDSYGAPPVNPGVAGFAAELLLPSIMGSTTPPPQVVPTTTGGLQFEWHERGIDLEVEVSAPFRVLVCFGEASGEPWEKEFSRDFGALADAVRRFELPMGDKT